MLAYAVAYAMENPTMPNDDERVVQLFKNGRNQALRIPREFELPGTQALMRREGHRLVIEPLAPRSLTRLLARLEPIEDDLPPIEELPIEPVDL
jgi:antitoxin VapB